MQAARPEPVEEYVPGVAHGRQYMARLCCVAGGAWQINVVHVESLAPLHGSDAVWANREEAAQAAHALVAALAS